MKKLIYMGLATLLVSNYSCRKLEETPYSSIFTEQFYKTPADAEAAINSVYDKLSNLYFGPSATLVPDMASDQVYPRPVVGRNTLTLFSYDPQYSVQVTAGRIAESPLGIWTESYAGIEKANVVIAKVQSITMPDARKNELLGEAHFLRAFFLWMLTKNFGDIPVKTIQSTTIEEAYAGKSPKAEVYKQIYEDLNKAVEMLPGYTVAGTVKGRPSKEAALALYAKAALYNEDWITSLDKAKQVINSGKYALMANVFDVYDVSKEDAARQENIWAFESESFTPANTTNLGSLYGPANSTGPAYGKSTFGSMFAYQAFYNSFDAADKRKTDLLAISYVNKTGVTVLQAKITPITPNGVLVRKFMDPNSVAFRSASNIPILRLADVYLIAAEAEFRINGNSPAGLGYINTVRRRAFGLSLTTPSTKDLAVLTLDAVLQERSWELFGEGDRFYDLTRTGKYLTVLAAAVNDVYPSRPVQVKHKYFPIPQLEINANPKLEQSPDWK